MSKFVMYRNTKSRVEFEMEEEVMEKMEQDKEVVDFDEFIAEVDQDNFNFVAAGLGYGPGNVLEGITPQDDWSTNFYKSKYGGLPCFIFSHTECDFIFLRPEDSEMLVEHFAKGISPKDWVRHTGYGANHQTDPR